MLQKWNNFSGMLTVPSRVVRPLMRVSDGMIWCSREVMLVEFV
jgi:hypothetical protein